MSQTPPLDPGPPSSPDELRGAVRGRVSGVTRIGPRAIGFGFFIVCMLLVAILYGLNRNGNGGRAMADTYVSPPPAPPTDEARFGANEPIVPTGAPATEPPPVAVPASSVPDLSEAAPPSQAAPPTSVVAQAPATPSQASLERDRLRTANEQARADAAAASAERYRSALKAPLMTGRDASGPGGFAGNGAAVADPAASTGGRSGDTSQPARTADASSRHDQSSGNGFLNGPTGQYAVQDANIELPNGGNPKDFLQSQRFAPISRYEIVASSVIPAALITGIDSELPGLLSAQVREDVYDSRTGRYLLIPKGSRLVGLYNNDVKYGQSRILVAWQRLIFPDTTSIDLSNMSGADVGGGSGLAGKVDNHSGKVLGAAILTSVLAAGLQLAQPQQSNVLVAPSTTQILSGSVATQIAQTGSQLVRKNLDIPPTIHIPKGYPFIVFVDRDMVLPGPYRER